MDPALLYGLVTAFILFGPCYCVPFSQMFTVDGLPQNIVADDNTDNVQLSLTQVGGAQFATTNSYLGGSFSVNLKLVSGESAGTVTAFYLTSYDQNHDEIDFEFLGNVSGQPYVLHTNLFANGVGSREQQVYLWFDPTADYHTYSVIWNHQQITFLADGNPIRIYRNIEDILPGSYPFSKSMYVSGSLYEASTWATRGGRIPIDWNYAPFEVNFSNFNFEACEVPAGGDESSCTENYSGNWWEGPEYQSLTPSQMDQLRNFRQSYMIYDYCTDQSRYPTPPVECAYNSV